MITPRRTRLIRVRTLHDFRRVLASLSASDPRRTLGTGVIVPTRSAARELRRTIERTRLRPRAAVILPELLTRDEWYARMHASLADPPRLLTALQREVVMTAASRDAIAAGREPPFQPRPGLIVEMLAFYDELRRRDQTVDRFEALLVDKLESSVEDRGAARLLQQTRFLAAAFRAYERRVRLADGLDEHALRQRLLAGAGARPLRRLVVTVGDRSCDPPGLWIADFDLIARMPALDEIDIVATENMLASGWHQRLDAALPGIEEVAGAALVDAAGVGSEGNDGDERQRPAGPSIAAPARDADRLHFLARDREEELVRIARRLKAERRREPSAFVLDRHAVVFKRPLPYLYLARTVFGSAGVPYQASDAVPLAAEPYAAAVDLAIEVVTSGFTRGSLVALLRSPHFALGADGRSVPLASVRAFDRRLSEAGYLGDLEALERLVNAASREFARPDPGPRAPSPDAAAGPAARAAWLVCERLRPLADDAPASAHLRRLGEFLVEFERPLDAGERHLRARRAILDAIAGLAAAHARSDDPTVSFADVSARLHRWMESQTFEVDTGTGGLHLVDAHAAPYGTYDSVHVVGLIERDWPEPAAANIFYSPRLLAALGWPAEPDRAAAPRAAFRDLVAASERTISFSTMTLEDDAIVDPSPFLDELAPSGLPVAHEPDDPSRIFRHEALASAPVAIDAIAGPAARWLEERLASATVDPSRFQGRARSFAPRELAVSAVERYLECPFKYFAVHVLALDEDPDDEDVMSPRARGLFIHQVFQAFFEAWGQRGAITPERLDEARALFVGVAERLLAALRPAEAAIERTRLVGSAVAVGLGDAVFRMEAERPVPVVERLLEFAVRGELDIDLDGERVHVRVRGVADRIDLLGDRTLRILDYKSGKAPQPRRALQLPLYSYCASRQLSARDAGEWKVGEAAYIAFGGPRTFVPMTSRGSDEQSMADAQARLAGAVAGMRRGEFLVQPLEPFRCTFCAYAGVCRKDYVGDE